MWKEVQEWIVRRLGKRAAGCGLPMKGRHIPSGEDAVKQERSNYEYELR